MHESCWSVVDLSILWVLSEPPAPLLAVGWLVDWLYQNSCCSSVLSAVQNKLLFLLDEYSSTAAQFFATGGGVWGPAVQQYSVCSLATAVVCHRVCMVVR